MSVDWSRYAAQYDLMAELNPAYQELVAHCVYEVVSWGLSEGSVVADLGGATGQVSTALAVALPHVQILHADRDVVMLERAGKRAKDRGVSNWAAHHLDLEQGLDALPPLSGAVSIHVLYALANPSLFLRTVFTLLQPSARLYACDLGRQMNTLDWGLYLTWHSLLTRGPVATVRLLLSTQAIREENAKLALEQRAGRYWTHTREEYRQVYEECGFEVLSEATMYRGYSDLVVARKPDPSR